MFYSFDGQYVGLEQGAPAIFARTGQDFLRSKTIATLVYLAEDGENLGKVSICDRLNS